MAYAPSLELRVMDPASGRLRPIPIDFMTSALRSVELSAEEGLAAEVVLTFECWDPEAGWFDPGFVAGTEFELWSGYDGDFSVCHGKFRVVWRTTVYPDGDLPKLEVRAHDGLSRTRNHQQSFVYEDQSSEVQPLLDIAKRAGLELGIDPILVITPKGDRIKEAGKTDLEYLKLVAMTYGLAPPRVTYAPDPSGQKFGIEILQMRRLVVASLLGNATSPRFLAGHGLHLRYMPTGPAQEGQLDGGELASFQTDFDTSDLPTAIEVIGYDRNADKLLRVVVKATPAGAVVESEDELTKKELAEAVSQFRNYGPFDPKAVEGGETLLLALLGAGGQGIETGRTYRAGPKKKTVKEKHWVQETLYVTQTTGAGVREFALRWMQTRIDTYFVVEGSIAANLGGANAIDVQQVHYVDGVLPADRGYYLTTSVHHLWDGGGHVPSFHAQRLLVEGAA